MYSAPLSDTSEFCLRLGMTLATIYRCPRGDKLSPMVDHLQKRLILVQNFGFGIPKSPERKERGVRRGRNLQVGDTREPPRSGSWACPPGSAGF